MEVLTYERKLLDLSALTAHNGGGEQFQTALSARCCFNVQELGQLSFFLADDHDEEEAGQEQAAKASSEHALRLAQLTCKKICQLLDDVRSVPGLPQELVPLS